MQRRVPPSSAFCSATAWPVVPLPAKKSSTRASSGIVSRIRRTSPVGLGDSKTWPTIALSSATAVSVEPTSSASQMVRSFLRRPVRCSQSFWKTSTRSPAGPLIRRQTRSSGRCVDQRRATSATPPGGRRRRPARSRLRAVERRRCATAPGLRVAPDREVQGARGDRVELLVGVAQRQVPVAAAVGVGQREVALVDRRRRCSRRARVRRASRA